MSELFCGRFFFRTYVWVALACLFSTPVWAQEANPPVVCLNSVRPDGAMVINLAHVQQTNRIVLQTYNADQGSSLWVSDGSRSVRLSLDQAQDGHLDVHLSAPLEGQTIVIHRDTASVSDNMACITHVEFLADSVPKRQAVTKQVATPMPWAHTTWFSAPSATAAGRLHFDEQGVWEWQGPSPLDPEQMAHYQGTYRVQEGRLQMRLGQSGHYTSVNLDIHAIDACPNTSESFLQSFHQAHIQNAPLMQLNGIYNSQQVDSSLAPWLISSDLGCF